ARFAAAFTFQYSVRPGTPAASMPDQVPKAVVQERYDRLVALQESISWEQNRSLVGSTLEVLVTEGEGRKDSATARLTGRAGDGRLVHFAPSGPVADRLVRPGDGVVVRPGDAAVRPGDAVGVRPGDVVGVRITYGAPHHLVADGPLVSHRRTLAGDHHEA